MKHAPKARQAQTYSPDIQYSCLPAATTTMTSSSLTRPVSARRCFWLPSTHMLYTSMPPGKQLTWLAIPMYSIYPDDASARPRDTDILPVSDLFPGYLASIHLISPGYLACSQDILRDILRGCAVSIGPRHSRKSITRHAKSFNLPSSPPSTRTRNPELPTTLHISSSCTLEMPNFLLSPDNAFSS